jgi:hypothetical protein
MSSVTGGTAGVRIGIGYLSVLRGIRSSLIAA